jgi:methionyl-tRNA formyltransferase
VSIGPTETASRLHDRLASLAADILPETLDSIASGTATEEPQDDSLACYAKKLDKAEARLDFTAPASLLERRIRAFDPSPGTWCLVGQERLNILEARVVQGSGEPGEVVGQPLQVACGEAVLDVTRVKRQGRKAMTAADLQRGFTIPLGMRLS